MQPEQVWKLATLLRAEKEKLYGRDSWGSLGLDGCLEAAVRKAVYLKAQKNNGQTDTPKFREDVLDLILWGVFTYCLSIEGTDGISTSRG